jgi:hypothetical protein
MLAVVVSTAEVEVFTVVATVEAWLAMQVLLAA